MSTNTPMRIDLEGMLTAAVRDVEAYEEAVSEAIDANLTDDLPHPDRYVLGGTVEAASLHRWRAETLIEHLRTVREGLRAGHTDGLLQFFDTYVIDGTTRLDESPRWVVIDAERLRKLEALGTIGRGIMVAEGKLDVSGLDRAAEEARLHAAMEVVGLHERSTDRAVVDAFDAILGSTSTQGVA